MNDRWNLILLILLLLGHLALLSSDARARGNRLEAGLLAALGPVAGSADAGVDATHGFFDTFRFARTLRQENRALEGEVERLRFELARLQGVEERLQRLSETAEYTPPETGETFVADVVFLDTASWLRTLVIYTGTAEPQRNLPVFNDRGLVGRIVVAAGRYAKVLLVNDRSFSASAMLGRTRQRGMVRGAGAERGESDRLILEHIPQQIDVRIGEAVVTAGIDGVFPRGIPIGTVVQVEPGQGLFQRIELEPAVDLALLEQVYVLTRQALPAEVDRELQIETAGEGR